MEKKKGKQKLKIKFVSLKEKEGCWRYDSTVVSTECCSFKGPKFSSQHPNPTLPPFWTWLAPAFTRAHSTKTHTHKYVHNPR